MPRQTTLSPAPPSGGFSFNQRLGQSSLMRPLVKPLVPSAPQSLAQALSGNVGPGHMPSQAIRPIRR